MSSNSAERINVHMVLNKPKVLVIFHSENIQSGATRSLTDIMNYLLQTNKYEIEVAFPAKCGSAVDYYKSKGVRVHHYHYGKLMQDLTQPRIKRIIKIPLLFIRLLRIKNEAKKAAKQLCTEGINIVYSNTSSIVFGGYLGKFLNAKQIWHIREFRKKDHRISYFLGDRTLKRFINSCADKVLCVSQSVMDDHKDLID